MSAPPDDLIFFTDRNLGRQFPDILAAAGLSVRRHGDLFAHDCPDDVWLEAVAEHGWIAVTHDTRIRYKPNELAAVVRHKARLLVVIGAAPYAQLAHHFVATAPRIPEFVEEHQAPWIAKVYRPTEAELERDPASPGTVSLWYPEQKR